MSEPTAYPAPVLEPAAKDLADATANPPYLFDLSPEVGRKAVDELQSGTSNVELPDVSEHWVTVPAPTGDVRVRIVTPPGRENEILPVIVYIHGAGWVFGNAHTHDRLVRELATKANAAVVFPDYSLSPEVRYPVAIEQNYATVRWVKSHGGEHGLDTTRIAVAGDSVGGNMAAALTLQAKEREDVTITAQVLFYPVTAPRHHRAAGRPAEGPGHHR